MGYSLWATEYGKNFFEGQMPLLIEELKKISATLEKKPKDVRRMVCTDNICINGQIACTKGTNYFVVPFGNGYMLFDEKSVTKVAKEWVDSQGLFAEKEMF